MVILINQNVSKNIMFKKILKTIKPTIKEEKQVSKIVFEFLEKLNLNLINAKTVVGGSFAKGTWLRNKHDIDIFVIFNNNQNISTGLEKIVKKSFKKYEKIHGSRDYFLIKYKKLSFELVPVLKIKTALEAENITDVSPMHVNFIKNNTNEKLKDDIRLAKYFIKVNDCYGAETFIGGFSGYLIELLIIYYKGFMNLVNQASKWNKEVIIDINKNNRFKSEQKFPLIVIDPVQSNRNAAAALREERFNKFKDICKRFIETQDDNLFKEKKVNLKGYDLVFKAIPLKGNADVVGTKILKVYEKIGLDLKSKNFVIIDSGWFWKKEAYLYFKVKNKTLDKTIKHYGPPIKFKEDCKRFKQKYKKVQEENGRLVVILPRRFTNINQFSKSIIKDKEIKNKVKSIRIVK